MLTEVSRSRARMGRGRGGGEVYLKAEATVPPLVSLSKDNQSVLGLKVGWKDRVMAPSTSSSGTGRDVDFHMRRGRVVAAAWV